jgi:hypothetical protein
MQLRGCMMKDKLIALTSFQVVLLALVDRFDLHNFGIESCLAILCATIMLVIMYKDNKK